MGLDITFLKPVKTSKITKDKMEKYFIFYSSDDWRIFDRIAKLFPDYIVKYKTTYFDICRWFRENYPNLNYCEYAWTEISHDYLVFQHYKNEEDEIIVMYKDLEKKSMNVKALVCKELGYQRNGVKNIRNFIRKYCNDSGVELITTKEDFKNALKYCKSGYPMLNWSFKENETFIYLNY